MFWFEKLLDAIPSDTPSVGEVDAIPELYSTHQHEIAWTREIHNTSVTNEIVQLDSS